MVYSEPAGESEENLRLMAVIDRMHMQDLTTGTRRMTDYLSSRQAGKPVARNRFRRLMRIMGIGAVYPRKQNMIPGGSSEIFPYLLKDKEIV